MLFSSGNQTWLAGKSRKTSHPNRGRPPAMFDTGGSGGYLVAHLSKWVIPSGTLT